MSFKVNLIMIFVTSVLFSAFVSAAITESCKLRGIKGKGKWGTLAFFFPFVVGIIYIIKMNKLTTISVSGFSRQRKVCIVFIVLALAAYGVNNYFAENIDWQSSESGLSNIISEMFDSMNTDYMNEFNHISFVPDNNPDVSYYYDRNGKSYIDTYEVLYYTANGDKYVFEYRYKEGCGLTDTQSGEFYSSDKCFVDENGFLVIDDELINYEKKDVLGEETFCNIYEKDGKEYYPASKVSWDSQGDLIK